MCKVCQLEIWTPETFGHGGGQNMLLFEERYIWMRTCPNFATTATAFFLSSYLCQDKTKRYLAPADINLTVKSNSPLSGLFRIWASVVRQLWHCFFDFDLWSRPWGVARLLGLRGILRAPIPRKESGSTITTKTVVTLVQIFNEK